MSALVTPQNRLLCSVLLCCALGCAMPAKAQVAPENIEVEWRAPPECPGRDVLLRMLHARLPERRATTALRAHAHVVRSAQGFRLELELVSPGARAERDVSDAQCAPLAEAAAVLIALAMQSAAVATEPPRSIAAGPEPETTPDAGAPAPAVATVPAPTDNTRSASAPRAGRPPLPAATSARTTRVPEEPESSDGDSPSRLRLQLSAAARAGLGTFPHQPALGMQAALAARIASMYIGLGLSYWPPLEQTSSSYPSARLRGSGIFSNVSLGVDVTSRPLVLTAAVELELGQLNADAQGIAGPQSNRTLWLATGPSAALGVTVLNDWSVALELAGLIPVYRTHWLVRTPAADVSAFVAAQVSWRLSLRISYVLPL